MKRIQCGPISANTYIVPLSGSNVFIVDPAASAFSGDEDVIVSFLKENNLNPVAVVLTHGHFDHVSGLLRLKAEYPELPVYIHKEDASYLGENSAVWQEKILGAVGFYSFVKAVSGLPEADGFLEDGKFLSELISCGDEALSLWKVIHTPGHTAGGICLYNEKDRQLISGDTLFYRSWGRTDFFGGSEEVLKKSLELIFTTIPKDATIFSGHDSLEFKLEDF